LPSRVSLMASRVSTSLNFVSKSKAFSEELSFS
jgi:hypothetical protein